MFKQHYIGSKDEKYMKEYWSTYGLFNPVVFEILLESCTNTHTDI